MQHEITNQLNRNSHERVLNPPTKIPKENMGCPPIRQITFDHHFLGYSILCTRLAATTVKERASPIHRRLQRFYPYRWCNEKLSSSDPGSVPDVWSGSHVSPSQPSQLQNLFFSPFRGDTNPSKQPIISQMAHSSDSTAQQLNVSMDWNIHCTSANIT